MEKSVTLIIPCLNEEKFISNCLDSIINNGYSMSKMEIIIVDGMSTDKTRDILKHYSETYKNIDVIDNPGANKPVGLNKGILAAKSDVVMRIDAHATYEKDYISNCIKYLYETDAPSVGGVRVNLPRSKSMIAKSIAFVLSSKFGVGNALYNTGVDEPKRVDIVFLFCVKRELFDEIGLFDERLIRGQDREFNLRMTKNKGELLLAPEIKSYYYARDKYKDFVSWAYVGGMTPTYISRVAKTNLLSIRNLVPTFFVLGGVLSLLLLILMPQLSFLFVLWVFSYLSCSCFFSISLIKKERNIRLLFCTPLIFFTYHFCYGVGSIMGLIKKIPRHKKNLSRC